MSQENDEVIRNGVTGLNAWHVSGAGDIHELLSTLLHQDVEWHDQTELPGASVHHGVREVGQHLMTAREALDYEAAQLVEILDADQAVLAHFRIHARGWASDVRVEREVFTSIGSGVRRSSRSKSSGLGAMPFAPRG